MDITLIMAGMAVLDKVSSRNKGLLAWTLVGGAVTALGAMLCLVVRGLV